MLFVDSSGWYSFFITLDPNHSRVRAHLNRPAERLFTTDYCIDETLTLLMARGEVDRALDAGRAFFQEDLAVIHFVKDSQIHRAWILFQHQAAAGWSFTDCTR